MSYITFTEGDIPIILSCPHDGKLKLNMDVRKKNNTNILENDTNMHAITLKIAKVFYNKIGKNPFLIINNIPRKYIDLNRSKQIGTENKDARKIWSQYHDKIKEYINKCKIQYGHCILFDMHGNEKTNNIVQLGYGISLKNIELLKFKGNSLPFLSTHYNISELIIGDRSMANFIKHLDVVPSYSIYNLRMLKEIAYDNFYYKAGYITKTYAKKYNIDCIQIELSKDLRKKAFINIISVNLADAIIKYYIHNYMSIFWKK